MVGRLTIWAVAVEGQLPQQEVTQLGVTLELGLVVLGLLESQTQLQVHQLLTQEAEVLGSTSPSSPHGVGTPGFPEQVGAVREDRRIKTVKVVIRQLSRVTVTQGQQEVSTEPVEAVEAGQGGPATLPQEAEQALLVS
jgi:hypothetical protein